MKNGTTKSEVKTVYEPVKPRRVEEQVLPVIIENDDPVAIVFYNKKRDRIIYMLEKANEDDIISLFDDNKKHG